MHRRWLLLAVALLAAACGSGPPPPNSGPASPSGRPPAVVTAPAPLTAPPSPASTTAGIPARLVLSATGLGPCRQPWWSPCIYGIRVEGADGYDHRGSFAWDPGPPPSGEMGMGTAGPVPSTGVLGDVPGTLDSGIWTLSFRLYYGSDAVSFNPVPGGTPRYSWEDPFTAACSAQVSVGDDVAVVAVRVAFDGADCTVTATYDGMTVPAASPGAKLTVDATGLGPCKVGFPYTCQYLVRLEGPGGRVDVAWFSYDYATAAPTASTGLYGEMPARLTRGIWAFSFGGVLSSDVVSFVPVPGATPRMMDLLPADVDCRATVTVTDQIAVGLHVTFRGETCSVITEEAIP